MVPSEFQHRTVSHHPVGHQATGKKQHQVQGRGGHLGAATKLPSRQHQRHKCDATAAPAPQQAGQKQQVVADVGFGGRLDELSHQQGEQVAGDAQDRAVHVLGALCRGGRSAVGNKHQADDTQNGRVLQQHQRHIGQLFGAGIDPQCPHIFPLDWRRMAGFCESF